MTRSQGTRFAMALIPAYLILLVLSFILGSFYVRFFLPLFVSEIRWLHPEYEIVDFKLNEKRQIWYRVIIHRPVADSTGRIHGGMELEQGVFASSMYIHPIIIFSFLIAWPGLPTRGRAKAVLTALPLLLLIELIDLPVHIICRLEDAFRAGLPSNSILGTWVMILNQGGRQFLSLSAAIVCIAPHYFRAPSVSNEGTNRNAPCPCGSGKKYKRCCLEK